MADLKRPFWPYAFSEPDGTPSASRVLTAVIVAFALGWVTYLVIVHKTLPEFTGLIAFVSALYGINKVTACFNKPPNL